MDNSLNCEIKGFIDERLNTSMESLRKNDADYRHMTKRLSTLLDKVENLTTANEEEKTYVDEYLKVKFDIQAKEEPVFYAQGFSDAIRFLRYFDLI